MSLLQHYVTAHADRRPDATAIVAEHDRVSYGTLERRSNQIARLLRELGCLRGDRVCLLDDVLDQIGVLIGEVRPHRVEARVHQRLEEGIVPVARLAALRRHGGQVTRQAR